jgi:hypothetical protein
MELNRPIRRLRSHDAFAVEQTPELARLALARGPSSSTVAGRLRAGTEQRTSGTNDAVITS